MEYIIHFDFAALAIMITVMLHFLYKKTISTRSTLVFTILLWVALTSTILDVLSVVTINHASVLPLWINYLLNAVYLITFNTSVALYYTYVLFNIKKNKPLTIKDKLGMFMPIGFVILLVATTPLTKLIFYFDGNFKYQHGPCMSLLYVIALYYMGVALYRTIKYSYMFTTGQKATVYFYSIGSIAAVVFQMFYPEVLILPFVLSIALLLVYLSLENPADYTDKDLGILNRNALVTTASSYFEQQKSFEVMGIHVDGLHSVREVFGVSGEKEILNLIARFLTSVVQNKVFYTAGQQFVILSSMSDNEWNCVADELVKRFKHPFTFNGVDVVLSINICMASSPNTVKCIEDVTDFIEYTQHVLPSGESLKAYLTEKELHSQKRTKQIQQILKTAIVKKQFKVYYQPIFSLEKSCYSSAEALIRLQNDELGFISPDEFIPIAEKSGLIIEIGRYVFREVCSFIADERLCDYGIECIDVNLSAVQCMQERLHEELVAIMDQYNLPYNFINLEITETAAVASSETLRKNMDKLINYGVNFSLDDFGTGFSNMTHLIQYPFHTIKIDKSMLWSAMEDEKAMMALKYTIAMIKDMNMDLIVEGVETKEQVELLSSLECKFFQGYYYSKAIPEEDFLALLKK